jgi:hypothetical protein
MPKKVSPNAASPTSPASVPLMKKAVGPPGRCTPVMRSPLRTSGKILLICASQRCACVSSSVVMPRISASERSAMARPCRLRA